MFEHIWFIDELCFTFEFCISCKFFSNAQSFIFFLCLQFIAQVKLSVMDLL